MKEKKQIKVTVWALLDKRDGKINYITMYKGNWYISPSLKKHFKIIKSTAAFTL